MLGAGGIRVFSKRAELRTAVGAQDAGRNARVGGGGRKGGAVRGRGLPVGAREAGGEGADAPQPDGEADVGDRAVGGTEQRGRPLEAPREQIAVRRLAEGAAELPAEVGPREPG